MSLKKVMEEIERFIESKSPAVMAIVGDWGVGKTYAWKAALKNAKNDEKIPNKNYSYVSLFGINDLNRLRFSIFENMVDLKYIGDEPSFLTLRDNLLNLNDSDLKQAECTFFKTLKRWLTSPLQTFLHALEAVINFFREPQKRICTFFTHCEFFWRKTLRLFFPALQPMNETIYSLSYASINETLICFDDLERTSLNLKDLLGVINELKEQKNCKVILIYNEEKLREVTELAIYNEKVIDISLGFEISADEAFTIVFEHKGEIYHSLRDFVLNLGIRNIRILEKICWLYELILPDIEGYRPEFKKEIQRSIVLFTYASYERDENKVPPLEYISYYSFYRSSISDKSELEQKWSNILSDYGYKGASESDLLLIETVKNGYIDSENFQKLAEVENETYKASKLRQSFNDVWKLYDSDLEIEAEKLVERFISSFNESIEYLSPIDLNSIVIVLRQLDRDTEADQMITDYVQARRANPSLFDPNHSYFRSRITDEKIMQAFKGVHEENSTQETAEDVLNRIAYTMECNRRDEIVLLNTPKEEFIRIFTKQKEDLPAYINACLRFERAADTTEGEETVTSIVKEALKVIAKQNPLNEIRMKKYGIILDKGDTSETAK